MTMTLEQFGQTVKEKYPQYAQYGDAEVGQKVLTKYPQYASQVSSDTSDTSPDNPPPDSPQPSQAPLGGAFTQGLGKIASDALPMIGSVGGAMVGGGLSGLLGLPTGPGAFATAVAGGAAGGAAGGGLGETAREYLQGTKLNAGNIEREGAIGGIGGAAGEVLRPVMGVATELGSHLPIIGPVIKGVSNVGETMLSKIFGAGDIAEVEGGANQLVKVARREGLTNLSSVNQIGETALQKLDQAGTSLGSALDMASEKGAGVTLNKVNQMIDESLPLNGNTAESKALVKKAKDYVAKIAQQSLENSGTPHADMLDPMAQGTVKIPVNVLNTVKQYFAGQANFGVENPSLAEKMSQALSGKVKGAIEDATEGMANVKNLNQRWWDLKQIASNVQSAVDRTAGSGGSRSPLSPAGFLKSPSVQLSTAQAVHALPTIAGQVAERRSLPATPSPLDATPQNKKPPVIDTDGRAKANPQAPYTKQQIMNGIEQDIAKGGKNLAKLNYVLNLYYPKVKVAKNPNTIQGRILNAIDALSNNQDSPQDTLPLIDGQ